MSYKLPAPDEERTYTVGSGPNAVTLVYKGVPPCLYCGELVYSPSMDGPLVCPECDIGIGWSDDDGRVGQERRAHFKRVIEEARRSVYEKLARIE